ANVAYPNIKSIFFAKQIKDRNGSIAGNILKRFNIIFDYRRALITLTKNNKFNEKFSYNKSGIELAHDGMRILRELKKSNIKENSSNQSSNNNIILENQYKISLKPAYAIVELREGSPAEQAGLKIGDVLLSLNGKQTYQFTLHQVIQMFYDDDGKKIRLRVDRDGDALSFNFKLQKLF
ncbi:PDZ domain-containing protein, partial [Algibacter sp.]|nr:PDZ domain-containing protein [Algibacter sp.]